MPQGGAGGDVVQRETTGIELNGLPERGCVRQAAQGVQEPPGGRHLEAGLTDVESPLVNFRIEAGNSIPIEP